MTNVDKIIVFLNVVAVLLVPHYLFGYGGYTTAKMAALIIGVGGGMAFADLLYYIKKVMDK